MEGQEQGHVIRGQLAAVAIDRDPGTNDAVIGYATLTISHANGGQTSLKLVAQGPAFKRLLPDFGEGASISVTGKLDVPTRTLHAG